MAILIKGMEMPINCHSCELSAKVNLKYGNEYYCQILTEMISNRHERKTNCPLVEPEREKGKWIGLDDEPYQGEVRANEYL